MFLMFLQMILCAFVHLSLGELHVDLTCVLCAPSEFELQIVYSMCVVCSYHI
jgi:hypothetical protein